MLEFSGEKNETSALVKTLWAYASKYSFKRSIVRDLFSFELGKQISHYKSRNHAMQRMWNKTSYNQGTEPTLNHTISIVSNLLNCFQVNVFSQNVAAKYYVMFLWAQKS